MSNPRTAIVATSFARLPALVVLRDLHHRVAERRRRGDFRRAAERCQQCLPGRPIDRAVGRGRRHSDLALKVSDSALLRRSGIPVDHDAEAVQTQPFLARRTPVPVELARRGSSGGSTSAL